MMAERWVATMEIWMVAQMVENLAAYWDDQKAENLGEKWVALWDGHSAGSSAGRTGALMAVC